jgi:thioesterase domain-containing protein
VMDTATLLSILRERDVQLSVEEGRLKCNAPAGALDAELRTTLASRRDDVIAFLRKMEGLATRPRAIVPIKPEGRRPPIFAVSGHGGDVFCLLGLARHLDAEQPMFGVQPPGLDGSEPLRTLEALACYEVEQIRRFRGRGPYLIAGHCAGGALAFEVAQQLIAAGQQVTLLALIGSPFPTMFQHKIQVWLRLRHYARALASGAELISRLQRRLETPDSLSGVSPAVLAARRRVESATVAAVRCYKPKPYPGRIDLFVTSDDWHQAQRWRAFGRAVHEHRVGDIEINDLLLGPRVTVLAASLQDVLRISSAACNN